MRYKYTPPNVLCLCQLQVEASGVLPGGCSLESGHVLITGGFVSEIISMSIAAFHSKLAVEIPKTNK